MHRIHLTEQASCVYKVNSFRISLFRITHLSYNGIDKAKFSVLIFSLVELFSDHAAVSEFKYRVYRKQRAEFVCNIPHTPVSAEILQIFYKELSYNLASVLCKFSYYFVGR